MPVFSIRGTFSIRRKGLFDLNQSSRPVVNIYLSNPHPKNHEFCLEEKLKKNPSDRAQSFLVYELLQFLKAALWHYGFFSVWVFRAFRISTVIVTTLKEMNGTYTDLTKIQADVISGQSKERPG